MVSGSVCSLFEKKLVSGRLTCFDKVDRPENFVPTTYTQEHQAVVGVLYRQDEILRRVKELAFEINKKYKDNPKKPLFISLEHGARPFADALITEYKKLDRTFDPSKDVKRTKITSYTGTESGDLTIESDLDLKEIIEQKREIIIVDDIVDTAKTMKAYIQFLHDQGAEIVRTCALLHKPEVSSKYGKFEVDFEGFSIENKFVIGFGLDYNGKYRDLPNICVYNTDLEKKKQHPLGLATDPLLETLEK